MNLRNSVVWSFLGLFLLPVSSQGLETSFSNIRVSVPEELNISFNSEGTRWNEAPSCMKFSYQRGEAYMGCDFYTVYENIPSAEVIMQMDDQQLCDFFSSLPRVSGLPRQPGSVKRTLQQGMPLLVHSFLVSETHGIEEIDAVYILPDRMIIANGYHTFPKSEGNILLKLYAGFRPAPEQYRNRHEIMIHHNGITLPALPHWTIRSERRADQPWLVIEHGEEGKSISLAISSEEGGESRFPAALAGSAESLRLGNREALCCLLESPDHVSYDEDATLSSLVTAYEVENGGMKHYLRLQQPFEIENTFINDLMYMLRNISFDPAQSGEGEEAQP